MVVRSGVALVLLLGCPVATAPLPGGQTLGDDSSAGSTTMSCPETSPCNYCPSAILCNRACVDDPPCSAELGAGMDCIDGTWICHGDPPHEFDCTDLCSAEPSCGERGCDDGIELQFFSGASFDPGVYEIAIDRDGSASTCTFVISEDLGCELPPCVTDTTCNASYALTAEPPQITMHFPVSDALSVSVAVDDDVRVEAAPPLAYELVAPNGPGCLPVCGVVTLTVDVP